MDKPLVLVKRMKPEPHYEVHYSNRVEFWDLTLSIKQGEELIEEV